MLTLGRIARDMRGLSRAGVVLTLATLLVVLVAVPVLAQQAAQLETQVITASTGTETRTSETATNVTQAQISKLPTPSRNFLDLAQLAPGVSVTEDRVEGQFRTVSAGGQAPSSVRRRGGCPCCASVGR